MTLPDERYRAVKYAEQFLQRLAGGEYPRVPKAVRTEARSILRHYPSNYDMLRAAAGAPDVFQERMEDLHKFVTKGQQEILAREQNHADKMEFIKSLK
jgi:predicted HAD superfamily Cof-like phosphohydrolase